MIGAPRKHLRLLLIAALSVTLGLVGLDFGLPNHQHAYPYNPDEWTPMQCLQRMSPGRLDFNPHYFEGPTFPIYLWGATFAAADLAGFVRIRGNERYYFDHPEDLARMLWLGRLWTVLFGVAGVVATYLLARRLGLNRATAELAALFLAIYPSFVVHTHFMKVNPLVTFLILATLLAVDHWIRRGGARVILAVGLLAGLALSTKYSAVILVPVIMTAGLLRWRGLAAKTGAAEAFRRAGIETIAACFVTLAVFIMGTPYSVLAPHEFFEKGMRIYFSQVFAEKNVGGAEALPLSIALQRVLTVHATAGTPVLLLAALPGLFLLARPLKPLTILVYVWVVLFFVTTLRAGHLATDSRFLPLYPFIALFAALTLTTLTRRNRWLGRIATLVVTAVVAFWCLSLLTRFTGRMPQELASDWARENLKGSESIHLASKAIYWNPDLPLREFLQPENAANYAPQTRWTFVNEKTYAAARARRPDVVFLTAWLPRAPIHMEWLQDPDYRVVATFPGKTHLFGRRFPVWIDFYDVDIWVLMRRDASPGS